jgi:hypothetical protein
LQTVNVEAGVNRNVKNIIKESSLIELYRNCHATLEKNLMLGHTTMHHTKADMTATYTMLNQHMSSKLPYTPHPGRTSHYNIPNIIDKGLGLFMKSNTSSEANKEDEFDESPELEDLNVELGL